MKSTKPLPGDEWFFPPRLFEEATGLVGIAGGWTMPIGIPLHRDLFGWNYSAYETAWHLISQVNPSLPTIRPDQLRDWVLGILSDINAADIRAWVTDDIDEMDYRIVEDMTGVRPLWRISSATILNIKSQCEVRRNPNA